MTPELIPHSIDDQVQVMFWELDEAIVMTAALGLGIMIEALGPCLLVGMGASWQLGRAKQLTLRGYLEHLAYWLGIMELNKVFTNGQIREWIE